MMKLDKLLYRYFKQIKNFGVDMDIVRSADEVDSISGAVVPGDQIHYSTVECSQPYRLNIGRVS